jgi:hypothetical protein
MRNFNTLHRAVVAIVAATAFAFSLYAQELPSKWYFGKAYHKNISKSWRAEGVAVATDYGQALLKAVKAGGSSCRRFFFGLSFTLQIIKPIHIKICFHAPL